MNIQHILLLLTLKIKILLNGFLKGESKKRIRKAFAFVGGGVVFAVIYLWIVEIFTVLAKTGFELVLVENTLIIAMLGFFIFLLASGITISIHYLFISSDLPLLMSSPISDDSIFTFKLVEAIFANSGFFLFIGIPILIAYGAVSQANWYYYPTMLLTSLCLLAIPISISFISALLIVRVIPANRAREIMAILLALVSLGIWLALQLVRASSFDQTSNNFNPEHIQRLAHLSHYSVINLLPSTWAARALTGIAHGQLLLFIINFIQLLFLTGLLFFIAIKLSQYAFQKGFIHSTQTVTLRKKHSEVSTRFYVSSRQGSALGIILAVFRRDVLLFIRDSRQFTNLLMFAGIMIILPLIQNENQMDSTFGFYRPYFFIVLFSSLLAAQTSSRLIPIEAKSFWLTKLMPQPGWRIMLGKFLVGFISSTLLSWVAVMIISSYYAHDLRIKILALLTTLGLSAVMSSIGLWFGIHFAKFDWDHPKRMLTTSGGMLLSLSVILMVGLVIAVTVGVYFFAQFLQMSQQFIDVAAISINYILIAILIGLINFSSAKKLEKMEWQF